MADPSPQVNPQVTDAVTQTDVKVVAESPAMSMGNQYMATSQALGNAAHWANTSQQNSTMVSQAATTMGLTSLYGVDASTTLDGLLDITKAVQ